MHIILFFSIFFSSLHALDINLDIKKDFIRNIVLKIDGEHYYPKKPNFTIKKDFESPFNVFVYSKDIKSFSFKLLMKKNNLIHEDPIYISHKSTITDIIFSNINSKIDIDKNQIYSIKKSIKSHFKNEINKYLSFPLPNQLSIDDKLEHVLPLINKKIDKFILTLIRKRLSLKNRTIYINNDNIDLSQHYLKICDLNSNSVNENGKYFNKIEDLNKVNNILLPNKTLVFKLFNKYSGELTIFNYLNKYENTLDKKNEISHIFKFLFDESITLCTNQNSIQDNNSFCHNFDVAENYINSEKELFNSLIKNIPKYILKKPNSQKIDSLRTFFYNHIRRIVDKYKYRRLY